MIRYALSCKSDHGFESWFQSAAAFDSLSNAGMISCPDCGSPEVSKALMAPSVKSSKSPEQKAAALKKLRAEIEANSDYVGVSFVEEARRIHAGEAPERSIYGEARLDEAVSLLADGIAVSPLPFIPARRTN